MSNRKITRKENKIDKGKPDRSIILFTLFMTIFGTIMIFNASVYIAGQIFEDQAYFLKLQLIWIVFGIALGTIIYLVDYHRIIKLITPLLLINILLLVLVLIYGEEINGARRWFDIGGVRIQPAEFVKPILIIFLAALLAKFNDIKTTSTAHAYREGKKKIFTFVFVLLLVSILIMLEPDMGTTIVICLTAIALFFLSSTSAIQTIGTIITTIVLGLVGTIAIVIEPYRLERISTYFQLLLQGEVADPRGTGYQLHQILIGIGSSGFWGKGFGQSRQRFGYLVENTAFTDSTFAVVLEEFGFISAVIVIGLWIFFLFKGYYIAKNAPDAQGKLIAIGITLWLTLQAMLNIAANIGIIPITGLPLPFFTYGGSSTIVTFASIALLLQISRYSNKELKSRKNFYGKIR